MSRRFSSNFESRHCVRPVQFLEVGKTLDSTFGICIVSPFARQCVTQIFTRKGGTPLMCCRTERGFSLPRYSAENGQASRRTSLREHAGNAQPTDSAKDRKRTASPSAALRFSFFLSCTFPRGSGSTFRGGFCFSHSFLAFFWLSLAAHFLLRGRNNYRLAQITTRPARMSTAAMAAARLTAKRRGRCSPCKSARG